MRPQEGKTEAVYFGKNTTGTHWAYGRTVEMEITVSVEFFFFLICHNWNLLKVTWIQAEGIYKLLTAALQASSLWAFEIDFGWSITSTGPYCLHTYSWNCQTADLFTFMTSAKSGLRCSRHSGVWSVFSNTLNSANLSCTASPTRLYTLILIYVWVSSVDQKFRKLPQRVVLLWSGW